MGISKLNEKNKARRIDILIAPDNEYYYSLLYFTGSYKININMRKNAKLLGYSLSEHGLKTIKLPEMKSEEDIFKLLKMKYIMPNKRN